MGFMETESYKQSALIFSEMAIKHLPSIIIGIAIFLIGWMIAKVIRKSIIRFGKRSSSSETAAIFLAHLSYVGIMIVIVLTSLSQIGIPITPISFMLAGILVGISMSLKSSVGNLSSGIVIAMFKPFKVGEFITIGTGSSSISGTVEGIQLFFSQLRTSDGREISVPNNLIMSRETSNFSNNEYRRNDFIVGIGYHNDLQQAKGILQDLIDSDKRILTNIDGKQAVIRTNELGADSVNILVRYWTKRGDFTETNWVLIEETKLSFDKAGINIPYQQRDVHIHQVSNTLQ
jgi:small conductance mechanosensitive channel